MRKPILAVIVLVLVAAVAGGVMVMRGSSHGAAKKPAVTSEGKPTNRPTAGGDQGGDREGGGIGAVLVDDDPKGELRLEGQVVDVDEKPVGGALVSVSSNPPQTVTTEADGSFVVPGLVARSFTLVARAPQGVAGPVTSKLTEKSDPVVLHLRPGAKVVVTVTDDAAKPVDGATVELRGIDVVRQTTKAGETAFMSVAPGGYQLAAWSEGKARTLQWINIGAGDAQAKLVLVAGAPVSGRVVDDSGRGIAGARVTYHGASDWSQQADERLDGVLSDKDGSFAFAALPSGSYRFAAAHSDFARGSTQIVTLDGAHPHDGIEIKLGQGATVRGHVVDAAKQPVASARVRIGQVSKRGMIFEPPRQAYTDAKGAFEIKGLARRELAAVAMHETGASSTSPVDTTNGDVSDVTLVIDVTGTIAGVVVDPQGNPIEGAQVSAGPNFKDQGAVRDFSQWRLRGFPQELTDGDGHFTLTGLAPGSYSLRATRSQSASRARRDATEGTIAETGTNNVKIVLQPEGAVKGKVLFGDGSAPGAFTVQIGFTQQSFMGGNGEFVLDALPPQKYELSVRGPSFMTKAVEVTVDPGKTADAGTITVAKGRVLSGVVVAEGQPVPNATVYAGRQIFGSGSTNSANFGPMGQGTKTDTTDTSGKFVISGLNEGDIAVVAEQPTIGRSKAMRVPTTMPGQSELVLELQKFGSLSGVLRVAGKPAEGVFVSCQSTTTPGAIYAVASGPDGAYRYDRLAPDTYKVSATVGMPMMGMKFYSKEIVVPSGKDVTLDLSADPGTLTLAVSAVGKNGAKIGVASAFLATGVVAAKTMTDLSLQIAGAGASSSQWVIIRNGEPAKFTEVVPGTYSVCVVPFPLEVQGMAAMGYAERHSDSMRAFCQSIKVNAAPQEQSMQVAVEPPAYINDNAGSGSGAP
ncbi:MAG TPA: carboxypeptidase regulatory-like domain-containing protein [Kofleriaceae bacterium]|nr:carboxypeptidase regulatory-like domain-containing protein [Kofleriaceae bacterium]